MKKSFGVAVDTFRPNCWMLFGSGLRITALQNWRTAVAGAALAAVAALGFARPAAAQNCVLEYQRADNGWAAEGRPDGFLGVESITLQPGQSRVFVTDWAYERRRNDGVNYYGSHLRIATNPGQRPVTYYKRSPFSTGRDVLHPGERRIYRHDLTGVQCEVF